MLRVGLAERTLELLRAAVADEETVARFRAKVLAVPGMDCLIFTGTVSGRGHGRFWLGHADHRDIVVIAHRFAFALEETGLTPADPGFYSAAAGISVTDTNTAVRMRMRAADPPSHSKLSAGSQTFVTAADAARDVRQRQRRETPSR